MNSSAVPLGSAGCDPSEGWVAAMHGLHTLETYTLAGASQAPANAACGPCPTLYLANGDNDVWAVWGGGQSGVLDNTLGDAGDIHFDPAYPKQAILTRGLNVSVAISADANPPLPGAQINGGVQPANFTVGPPCGKYPKLPPCPWGPGNPTFTQIMALPNQSVTTPLYFAVVSPPNMPDQIVKATANPPSSTSWTPADTGSAVGYFANGSIMQLRSSYYHRLFTPLGEVRVVPQLWILAANAQGNGQVYQGNVVNGKVAQWYQASGTGTQTIGNAADLFVNPYNSNYAWVTDLEAKTIQWTTDGGVHWNPVASLTNIATNGGEFRFECDSPFFDYACPLSGMSFSRLNPGIVVAVLYPGGVAYSNTSGNSWAPLPGVTAALPHAAGVGQNLPGYPISVWFDDNPVFGTPAIYVSLHWNRTIRIDGDFNALPEQ